MLRTCILAYLVALAAAQSCTELDNCSSCDNPDMICTLCPAGFGMRTDEALGCLACPSNCIECVPSSQDDAIMTCLECSSGFVLDTSVGMCLACTSNCEICDIDVNGIDTICTSCFDRFAMTSDKMCLSCPIDCNGCRVDGLTTECTTCSTDYVLNSAATPDCLLCPSSCQSCVGTALTTSATQAQCTSSGCLAPFYFNINTGNCDVCLIPNCIQCGTTGDSCAECSTGFRLIGTDTCDPCDDVNCMTCGVDAVTNIESCSVCDSLYTLTGGVDLCIRCPTNCVSCLTETVCQTCVSGYKPVNGACVRCPANCLDDASCTVAATSTECTVCADGFGVDANGQCIGCFAGCATCPTDAAGCTACQQGYNPDAAPIAECAVCTAASSCLECATAGTPAACTACAPGSGLDGGTTCAPCTAASNCLDCPANADVCTTCPSYTYLSVSVCAACANPTCFECSDTACLSCAPDSGLGLDTADGCSACLPSNCLTCSADNTVCSACDPGYILNAGECFRCPSSCTTCNFNAAFASSTECSVCSAGYRVDAGSCVTCGTGCSSCTLDALTSAVVCDICTSGYGLQSGACFVCPGNCATCTDNQGILECNTCIGNYFLQENRDCTRCSANCLLCAVSDGIARCNQCDTQYALTETGDCVACPSGCITCTSSGGVTRCSNCFDGFALSQDRTSCIGCSSATDISSCGLCTNVDNFGTSNCTSCAAGFAFRDDDTTDTCTPCNELPDCAACRDRAYVCDAGACANGYQLDEEGRCAYYCYECGYGEYLDEATCGPEASTMNYTTASCPFGNCWVERRSVSQASGIPLVTFRRGCMSTLCTSYNDEEDCSTDINGVQECKRCCEGDLCNSYTLNSAPSLQIVTTSGLVLVAVISFCLAAF